MEVIERPRIVSHPHPLVGDGRELCYAEFVPGETLGDYVIRNNISIPSYGVHVWHNGYKVPGKLWRRLIPRNGDQVVIRAALHGGGGGGGNKVLKTVLMVAVMVAAIAVTGGAAAGLLGAGTLLAGSTGAMIAGALVGMVGGLLVNALIPAPKQSFPELGTTNSKQEQNPTYSIAGANNQSRPWQSMNIIFGRHKVVPDLASTPYTEFVGNDQYLNQAFHFGLQGSSVDITDIRLGDTPISNFQSVQIQRSAQDGKLTLFPGNVDNITGFALNNSDGWIQRTTPINTNHIKMEFSATLYYANDDGTFAYRSCDYQFQYAPVGTTAWVTIGQIENPAIYATHYWSKRTIDVDTDQIGGQIEYGSTNYGDHTQGERGFYADPVYNWEGNPISGQVDYIWQWIPHPHTQGQPWQGVAPDPLLVGVSVTPGVRQSNNKTEPLRFSIETGVPLGQYDVRVIKATGDIANNRESNASVVNQIICYQPDNTDYTGQARLGIRIKASSQLQGQIQNMTAICEASCPVWNGSGWVVQKTQNPAYWFLWFAVGVNDASGNRMFGGGLSSAQIDIDSILAWAAFCDSKGLQFNYVLSQSTTVHDVLTMIARAGRASYTWQTGKLGVVWDAANLPAVAMIGPYNIVAGSFGISYVNEGTVDEIVMNFINPARNWEQDNVRVVVPNVTRTNNVVTMDLDGCTSADLAGREANLIAASQAFHRRRVSWEMDIEGMVAQRGDVVQMSHDLTIWGYAGRLIAGTRTSITLDQHVPTDGSGWLSIRSPRNEIITITGTSAAGEINVLNISGVPDWFLMPSDDINTPALDWSWQFDPLETPGRRIKIVEVKPASEDRVSFVGIDDFEGYYLSENDPYAYTPPRQGLLLMGVILDISFSERILVVADDVQEVVIGWTNTNNTGQVLVTIAINGVASETFQTSERRKTITAQTDDIITVSVKPISNVATGDPYSENYKVVGLRAPLPPVVNLTNVFRDGFTVLTWSRVVDIRNPVYEVRIGSTWANAQTVAVTPNTEIYALGNGLYHVAAKFSNSRGILVYGEPDTILISGSTLARNFLVGVDEHPDWDGDFYDGAINFQGELTLEPLGDILALDDIFIPDDLIFIDGCASYGVYETNTSNVVDIGYPAPVMVGFDISTYAFNFHQNVLTMVDVLAELDILNDSDRQYYSAQPQIRYAGDDGVFGNWVNYVPGLINARYFDVRLVLTTTDPLIVPFVTSFTWTIDVPDLIQKAETVTIGTGGLTVTYPKAFHIIPNVQIAVFDAIDGDRYVLSNSTPTGFDIQLFNGSTAVTGQINWLSQGY
jgi:predicted phage tail protein